MMVASDLRLHGRLDRLRVNDPYDELRDLRCSVKLLYGASKTLYEYRVYGPYGMFVTVPVERVEWKDSHWWMVDQAALEATKAFAE